MRAGDVDALLTTFASWGKTRELFERYFRDHCDGTRTVLVAVVDGRLVGYATLMWASGYPPFAAAGIPEIVDISIADAWQRRGIGTAIIRMHEQGALAGGRTVLGIGVECTPQYAYAARLYPFLGFEPDGRGIDPENNELHLTRRLV